MLRAHGHSLLTKNAMKSYENAGENLAME